MHNCECFKKQMSRFIDFSDDKALIVNNNEKEKSGIQGRYDFVMLRKENDKLYIPVLVELKSKIDACTYPNAGIINHVSDMEYFLESYKKDANNIKTNLRESIKTALEFKKELGLINEDICDYIDFDKPEFRLLFVMVDKEKNKTPHTRYDTDNLVDKEIDKAKSLFLHKEAKSNKKVYETMLKKQVNIEVKMPKWELEKYPDIVNKIKDKVYNYAYYDEFNKVK